MKPQLISSQPISTEGAFLTKLQQDYVMPLHGLFEHLCQGYVPVYDLLLGLKLGLLPHIFPPLSSSTGIPPDRETCDEQPHDMPYGKSTACGPSMTADQYIPRPMMPPACVPSVSSFRAAIPLRTTQR